MSSQNSDQTEDSSMTDPAPADLDLSQSTHITPSLHNELHTLQQDYHQIMQQNNTLPSQFQLSNNELQLDNSLKNKIEQRINEQRDHSIEQSHRPDGVTDTNQTSIHLHNSISLPFTLYGIRQKHMKVYGYHVYKYPPWLQQQVDDLIHNRKKNRNDSSSNSHHNDDENDHENNKNLAENNSSTSEDHDVSIPSFPLMKPFNPDDQHSSQHLQNTLTSLSFSKATSSERRHIIQQLQQHGIQRPPHTSTSTTINSSLHLNLNPIDEDDTQCIEYVKTHMGDMKLKTSVQYIKTIAKEKRMNVMKKKHQLLHVYKEIQQRKTQFNDELSDLRIYKLSVIHTINRLSEVLQCVTNRITVLQHSDTQEVYDGVESHVGEKPLKLHVNMHEFTDLSITKGIIKQEQVWEYYMNTNNHRDENENQGVNDQMHMNALNLQKKSRIQLLVEDDMIRGQETLNGVDDVEQLNSYKLKCIQQIKHLITTYDQQLSILQKHTLSLNLTLQQLTLYISTLYQELDVLIQYEEVEQRYTQKIQKINDTKKSVVKEVNECEQKIQHLEEKRHELKGKEQKLSNERFYELLNNSSEAGGGGMNPGEKHPYYTSLLRIYKRRGKTKMIKNRKEMGGGDQHSGSGGSSSRDHHQTGRKNSCEHEKVKQNVSGSGDGGDGMNTSHDHVDNVTKNTTTSAGGGGGTGVYDHEDDNIEDLYANYNSDEDSDFDTDSSAEEGGGEGEGGVDGGGVDLNDPALYECPEGCSEELYHRVKQLREERLDIEYEIHDCDKVLSEATKQVERMNYRMKQIDKEVENVNKEIEVYEVEKQQQLNKIQVTLPMKLSQIRYLVDMNQTNSNTQGGDPQHQHTCSAMSTQYDDTGNLSIQISPLLYQLPATLENALIIPENKITELEQVIHQHEEQRHHYVQQLQKMKQHTKQLNKLISQKKQLIEEEQKKCNDIQMLKFGQLIDLSVLDAVQQDPKTVELNDTLQKVEKENSKSLKKWEKKIDEVKHQLHEARKTNTEWLERVKILTERQVRLDESLREKGAGGNASVNSSKTHRGHLKPYDRERIEADKAHLIELTSKQEIEIEQLKNEIYVLSHKSGSLYTQHLTTAQ